MKKHFLFILIPFFASIVLSAQEKQNSSLQISEKNLREYIKTLSSDEFLGRAPAHEGEEKTINYLVEQYKKLGLKPLKGNSFIQKIKLAEITPSSSKLIEFKGSNGTVKLELEKDYVADTRRVTENIIVEPTEVIFAGYGIVAPEYNWDDFKGIDVKNKIIIVMINDPGYATSNPDLFTGKAMTYYGRWTYKYEEAARHGAAGVFIIHETGAASYPWEVVVNGRLGPQYYIEDKDKNFSRCKFEAWITLSKAKEIFSLAGLNLEEELKKAAAPGYKAKPLGLTTSLKMKNKVQHVISRNVIGMISGSERPDESIFFSAHWDHFGFDPNMKGDQIFNGARDNATGVAGILDIARLFSSLKEKPKRTLVFFSPTCEEQGLIGSEYYVKNPLLPIKKTVAIINLDGLNIFGKTKDIAIIGYGQSELDNYVKEEASKMGMKIIPDPMQQYGAFFRSDHFNFAKVGVPSVYFTHGIESAEGISNFEKFAENWNRENYHKVTDEYKPSWNLAGMIDEVQLAFNIGLRLSNEKTFPKWSEKSQFRSLR